MTCGIYLLVFENTDKVYVGQSSNIERRYSEHKTALLKGYHSKKLQEAYIKFGIPKLIIALECEPTELYTEEANAIKIFDSINNGFNTTGATGVCLTTLVGETAPSAKYSNEQIESTFKLLLTSNYTQKLIAEKTGVSITTVTNIFMGKKHQWLKDKYPIEYEKLMLISSKKASYSKDKIEEVFKLLLVGTMTQKEISEITGISIPIVGNISSGARHLWLKDKYPEDYETLMSMKGNRLLKKEVTLIKGDIVENVTNITKFAKKYNINVSGISELISNKVKASNGWSVLKST